LLILAVASMPPGSAEIASECSSWKPGWILCEDFERGDFVTLCLSYSDMRWLRSGDAGLQPGQLRLLTFNQGCRLGTACPAVLDQYQKWDQIVISTSPVGP
jgi:hypothetical protein